ncbi:MAG: hypothetical protein JWM57_3541 [Phycisphaerales bacterium]|nr:hypothetical protein [Phycisphaerales bacterium]
MSTPSTTTPPSAQIMCPHLKCRKVLAIPLEARGQVVKCSHCQNLLRVPANMPMPKPKVDAA